MGNLFIPKNSLLNNYFLNQNSRDDVWGDFLFNYKNQMLRYSTSNVVNRDEDRGEEDTNAETEGDDHDRFDESDECVDSIINFSLVEAR
jgi:hypothetical protein